MIGIRALFFPPGRNKGVAELIVFGWRGALAAILAGLVISFLLCGYWYPYWRIADMDITMAYQGFLVNAGYPQDFFDHPGHIAIILTASWFQLFHWLGLLDVASLARMPPASDAAAFDHVWTQAIRAGRVLSLAEAMSFVVAFALLLRRLIGDWQVAILATFCLAFSGGLMMLARTFRTDLLAAGLVTCGFLILLIAARSPSGWLRPVLVGLAAALCTLAIVNKVQALLMVMALLPVIPFFGVPAAPDTFWRSRKAFVALAALAVVAVVLAVPAGKLVVLGLSTDDVAIPLPFGVHGLFHPLIAGLVLLIMAVFAWLWRAPATETAGAMIAVAAGIALGLLSLELLYHPRTVAIVVNPIEFMYGWARGSNPELAAPGTILSGSFLSVLAGGALDVLTRLTFVLQSSPRPTIFVEWLVVAGAVLAWRRGHHMLVWQVSALLAAAFAVDLVNTLRGLKLEYFLYTDPLVVIAAAWLLAHLPDLKTHRWTYATGIAVFWIHIAIGQAEPVKHMFKKSGPEVECWWLPQHTGRIERFPFCPPIKSPTG